MKNAWVRTWGAWAWNLGLKMITGFNTDVEHEGVIYHVQTEDKGLDTPLILSLVYVGGAILASKRSPYDDLITKGFDERELSERLNRQHRLICAAIRAGRIEDLKRMSGREPQQSATAATAPAATFEATTATTKPVEEVEPAVPAQPKPEPVKPAPKTSKPAPVKPEPLVEIAAPILDVPPLPPVFNAPPQMKSDAVEQAETPQPTTSTQPPAPPDSNVKKSAPSKEKGVKQSMRAILQDVVSDFARAEAVSVGALHISLLEEKEFRGGEMVTIRIRVGQGAGGIEPIAGAEVTVKVLGSTFRPLIFPTRTASDGIATVRAGLPHFQTGRAAILVRAAANGFEAELRRIIHQG